MAQPAVRPGSAQAWSLALRPQSFPIAIAPVVVGASLAWLQEAPVSWMLAGLALLAAVLMQAITNLQNDVGYARRVGQQDAARIGLPRASTLGLLTPVAMRRAIVLLSVMSAGVGLALAAVRGTEVLLIGAASLVAALAYMGGPRPIAYSPWGEVTVLVFFDWTAVGGTYWLLTGRLDAAALWAGTAQGSLAALALAINNHRDRAHDALSGRRTWVVVMGERRSHLLFRALLVAAWVASLGMAWSLRSGALLWVCALVPAGWKLERNFRACPPGLAYNALLFRVFRLNLWFAALVALGAVLHTAVNGHT